jgi:hypothetical protein
MSKWQGSNLRSLVPKTSGLPTFLHLEVIVLINGLEPITSTVSGGCSNQLSYINIFLDPRTGIEPISSAYKAVASPTKLTRNLARVKGFEPLTTILETVMIPFHHTRIFVIPTRFELVTPSLKVRCSKPAELRDHFLCLQMDSNHRTPKRATLQEAAIAAMRYRHVLGWRISKSRLTT